jgi:hypothetical protein
VPIIVGVALSTLVLTLFLGYLLTRFLDTFLMSAGVAERKVVKRVLDSIETAWDTILRVVGVRRGR